MVAIFNFKMAAYICAIGIVSSPGKNSAKLNSAFIFLHISRYEIHMNDYCGYTHILPFNECNENSASSSAQFCCGSQFEFKNGCQ